MVPAPAASPAPAPAQSTRSNGRYNNRRRNGNSDNSNTNSNKFVPKVSTIESLASSSEKKGQDFTKFQKSIHHHALTTFKNSKDKVILEFSDPHAELCKNVPNLTSIRTNHNLCPSPPFSVTVAVVEDQQSALHKSLSQPMTIFHSDQDTIRHDHIVPHLASPLTASVSISRAQDA